MRSRYSIPDRSRQTSSSGSRLTRWGSPRWRRACSADHGEPRRRPGGDPAGRRFAPHTGDVIRANLQHRRRSSSGPAAVADDRRDAPDVMRPPQEGVDRLPCRQPPERPVSRSLRHQDTGTRGPGCKHPEMSLRPGAPSTGPVVPGHVGRTPARPHVRAAQSYEWRRPCGNARQAWKHADDCPALPAGVEPENLLSP